MKYILTILFFLISIVAISQPYIGTPSTITYIRGKLKTDSGTVVSYNFPDTISANRGIIKTIPNIVITVNDTLWKRSNTAQFWSKIGSGASAPVTPITQEFTGSTSLVITLSHTPLSSLQQQYYYNGVLIQNADFNVSGTTLTLSNFLRESNAIITAKYYY